ncbi:hypothetical protein V6N12_012245 [Hibiscus sabdariffa]|uniref:Uncharacterized protein n=1 Tax=Hibiscus sabdariffa TaxID=183260 RepID=A0ABR2CI21_9ROSI
MAIPKNQRERLRVRRRSKRIWVVEKRRRKQGISGGWGLVTAAFCKKKKTGPNLGCKFLTRGRSLIGGGTLEILY